MAIFKKIYIEVTNCCNLTCGFCHRTNRPKAYMTGAEFETILLKIKDYTRFIYLHVLGEAMLHPEFGLLLELSHRYGFQVNLTTNGTLLQDRADLLIACPAVRQLNVSMHSFERSGGSKPTDYLDGILAFIERAWQRQSAIWLNLRLWDTTGYEDLGTAGRNTAILQGLQDFFSLPDNFAAGLAPGRSLTLAPRIFLSRESRFDWPHSATEATGDRGTCRGLRDHIAILVDGTVVPCCLDAEADIALGNIHQLGLEQILAGPRACRMRTGFLQQYLAEALCRRCTYRLRFL